MQVKDATGDTTRLLVVGDSQRGEYAPLVALWLRVMKALLVDMARGWDRLAVEAEQYTQTNEPALL